MSTSKDFIVKNGLQVNGNIAFTGTLTGDGSGLTGAGVSDYTQLTNKPFIPSLTSQLMNDAGFLTSFTESDPIYTGSSWYTTSNNSGNWDTAYGWGNHASAGYAVLNSATAHFTGDLQIDGDLTVSGTQTIINTTNLAVEDNMIYLNSGSTVANPDLGITGNYNDGTYLHTGVFRDTSDGKWKFFDSYVPEPDASAYIDTTHPSFALAPIQVGTIYTGSTGYNGSIYAGTVSISDTPLTVFSGVLMVGGSAVALQSSLASVATTGSYNDLIDKPTLFSGAYADLTGKPTLATVATTGDYNDLINKPSGGSGTVTSVALSLPSIFSVSGSPVTTTGTLTATLASQTANTVFAAPNGSAGAPTFRTLVAADIPTLNQNTTGSAATFTSTTQNSQFNSLGVGVVASGTAGEIRAGNNITAYYSSDRSLKENIKDVDNALDVVCAIGSKTFDWTDEYINSRGGEDGYFIQKSDFGVVAQDVQAVFPQAVRTREDGTLAVDYEKLATLSFGAIQALVKRIEALEAK